MSSGSGVEYIIVEEPRWPSNGDYHAGPAIAVASTTDPRVMVAQANITRTARAIGLLRGLSSDELDRALWALLLNKVESRLESGQLPEDPSTLVRFDVTSESDQELAFLQKCLSEKSCLWRHDDGRSLLCTAPAPNDETATLSIDGRPAAPTSLDLCRRCEVPPEETICANFSHPEVIGIRTFGGTTRLAGNALCRIGRPEINDMTGCVPGRHHCWQRTVRIPVSPETPVGEDPLDLVHALDRLNVEWDRRFQQRLFNDIGVEAARLVQPCRTADQFVSRMVTLGGVLERFNVPGSVVGNPPPGQRRLPTSHLKRLRLWAERNVTDDLRAHTLAAIDTLLDVQAVRHKVGHPEGSAEVEPALRKVGISYPIAGADAWRRIQFLTVGALNRLREAVEAG